jgi:Flp pilus assembly protein TadD
VYDFEKTGDSSGAIRTYKSALTRWPEDTDILFALANAEYTVSNFAEAEKDYRKLLALSPAHPLALNNLAMVLCRTHRSDEGLKLLDKVVSDDPKVLSLIKSSREEIEAGCILVPNK